MSAVMHRAFGFEGHEVRVITQDGSPWWVLADVCAVLEISKHRDAAARLDADERGSVIVDTLGGPQETVAVNESGLWSLVLASRKPTAKRFRKWITSEVIPTIRKTGGYMIATVDDTPETLLSRAMAVLQATVEQQGAALAALAPKVVAHDRIARMDGLHTLTEAAKECGCPRDRFISFLHSERWIYRGPNKSRWLGHAEKERAGLLTHKVFEHRDDDGRLLSRPQVVLTAKGLARIAAIMPAGVVS